MMPAMTGLQICGACMLAFAACATRAPAVRLAPDSSEWKDLHRKLDESEEPRDLPIGFLRWWFFTPLGGTLFAGGETGSGTEWLLRDGDVVSDLLAGRCSAGSLLRVVRRVRGREEVVDECKSLSIPREGDWVKYSDNGTGLRVDLVVESVSGEQPRPEAFSDPDGERGGT
jgi:hypothetical protein